MPDDHSELVPPLPIPNRTVKRLCADDSAATSVKVGHRQAFIRKPPSSNLVGGFCFLRRRIFTPARQTRMHLLSPFSASRTRRLHLLLASLLMIVGYIHPQTVRHRSLDANRRRASFISTCSHKSLQQTVCRPSTDVVANLLEMTDRKGAASHPRSKNKPDQTETGTVIIEFHLNPIFIHQLLLIYC